MRVPRIVPIVCVAGIVLAGCGIDPGAPPPGTYRADDCLYAAEIQQAWAGTGDEHWAVDVAIRESGCNPCGYYPSQSDCHADPRSARGMFQLVGHADLEHAACPLHPRPWSEPYCAIHAARLLYDGSGRSPWGG